MAIPFRYVGQATMSFEFFGAVEPDQVLNLGEQIVEKFRHRSDFECLDYDALAEYEALKASEAEPETAPAVAPEVPVVVTPPPAPTVSPKPKNDAAPAATQE
jgi:hypothetical protein